MHDIRTIRENPAAFDAALSRRGLAPMSAEILVMDNQRRANILSSETAQAAQNAASKEAGAAKARGDDAQFERLRAIVSDKKVHLQLLSESAAYQDANLKDPIGRWPISIRSACWLRARS